MKRLADLLIDLVNRQLIADERSAADIEALVGRTLTIKIRNSPRSVSFKVTGVGLEPVAAEDLIADVELEGRLADFVALGASRRNGDGMAAGRVEIRGDLAVAQRVQRLIENIEFDWEELLARRTGDVFAHQFGRTVRQAFGWFSRLGEKFESDLAEYLVHEARLLPSRPELGAFYDDCSDLAADVDRLDRRVSRIANAGLRR
jgi:ubiquinone biosynthesis protein UbiJ